MKVEMKITATKEEYHRWMQNKNLGRHVSVECVIVPVESEYCRQEDNVNIRCFSDGNNDILVDGLAF